MGTYDPPFVLPNLEYIYQYGITQSWRVENFGSSSIISKLWLFKRSYYRSRWVKVISSNPCSFLWTILHHKIVILENKILCNTEKGEKIVPNLRRNNTRSCKKIVRPHHTHFRENWFPDCTNVLSVCCIVLWVLRYCIRSFGGQERELAMKHVYLQTV